MDLEAELALARDVDVSAIADAIQRIGFECTRCGHCCKGLDGEHTATVFPEEIRDIQARDEYDWRDVARPMPYGLDASDDEGGETFEWALQTDDCGDCTFYDEAGACTIYGDRPLICQTYPFSLALDEDGGAIEPMGSVVERDGPVRAHECEGLGRDISRDAAEELAETLKDRAITELQEALAVRENYEPTETDGVVVHDSEGQKRPDGTPLS